jgi:hypothetical protein
VCIPLKFNWLYRGQCRFYLPARRINSAASRLSFHAGILLNLFLEPEDGGEMSLRNVG